MQCFSYVVLLLKQHLNHEQWLIQVHRTTLDFHRTTLVLRYKGLRYFPALRLFGCSALLFILFFILFYLFFFFFNLFNFFKFNGWLQRSYSWFFSFGVMVGASSSRPWVTPILLPRNCHAQQADGENLCTISCLSIIVVCRGRSILVTPG